MNKRENNRMNMYRVVDAVLSRHEETIAKTEALSEVVTKFRGSMEVLRKRDNEYQTVAAGVTAAKDSAAEGLAEQTFAIANALYVFGRKVNNEQIKAECRLKQSNFNSMTDSALQQCGARILDLAQANAAAIASFGISAENIEALKTSIESFSLQLNDHHLKHAESKAARDMLYSAFDAANEILKEELDVLIKLVKAGDIEFYNQYQAARVIKDLGGHTMKTEPEQPVVQPVTA